VIPEDKRVRLRWKKYLKNNGQKVLKYNEKHHKLSQFEAG
jgi:hypothetical protein